MDDLNAALEAKGFKVLGYAQIGFRHITNSKSLLNSRQI